MSKIPENLLYTNDHEWVLNDGDNLCTVGITDYAQDSLGDVTFVEVPGIGTIFSKEMFLALLSQLKRHLTYICQFLVKLPKSMKV